MPFGGPTRLRQPWGRSSGARALAAAALALTLLAPARQAAAQDPPPTLEYRVKAAFLFNFAKFVDWPPETFSRQDAPFVVGILDREPFGDILEQVVRGKTVDGRSLEVRRLKRPEEAAGCQIVFVGARETSVLPALLHELGASAVLTVGDTERFTRQGGMVNFVVQDNRVRFEINADAARRAGLKISSKLLQLATIVQDVRPAEDTR